MHRKTEQKSEGFKKSQFVKVSTANSAPFAKIGHYQWC